MTPLRNGNFENMTVRPLSVQFRHTRLGQIVFLSLFGSFENINMMILISINYLSNVRDVILYLGAGPDTLLTRWQARQDEGQVPPHS